MNEHDKQIIKTQMSSLGILGRVFERPSREIPLATPDVQDGLKKHYGHPVVLRVLSLAGAVMRRIEGDLLCVDYNPEGLPEWAIHLRGRSKRDMVRVLNKDRVPRYVEVVLDDHHGHALARMHGIYRDGFFQIYATRDFLSAEETRVPEYWDYVLSVRATRREPTV